MVSPTPPKFHFHEPESVKKPSVAELAKTHETLIAKEALKNQPKSPSVKKVVFHVQHPLEGIQATPHQKTRNAASLELAKKNIDDQDALGKIRKKATPAEEEAARVAQYKKTPEGAKHAELKREEADRLAGYKAAHGDEAESTRITEEANTKVSGQLSKLTARQRLDLFQAWGKPQFTELQKEFKLAGWPSEVLRGPLEKAVGSELPKRPGAFPPPGRPPAK